MQRKSNDKIINDSVSRFPKNEQMERCEICKEVRQSRSQLKNNSSPCCPSDTQSPKNFSADNTMVQSTVSCELCDLTQCEEMLIARAFQ